MTVKESGETTRLESLCILLDEVMLVAITKIDNL